MTGAELIAGVLKDLLFLAMGFVAGWGAWQVFGTDRPTRKPALPIGHNGPEPPASRRPMPPPPPPRPYNAETMRVIHEADAGRNLHRYSSVDAMFERWQKLNS